MVCDSEHRPNCFDTGIPDKPPPATDDNQAGNNCPRNPIGATKGPIDFAEKFLKQKKGSKRKTPGWAKDLKEIIQDQIDTNLALSLKEISKNLDVHPSYLSREFSKYFEDLSFGEYIRKLRIEKAIQLMHHPGHSLTEIAYLTGFSDQSHFTRIFKKHTGKNPLAFRKNISKNKPVRKS